MTRKAPLLTRTLGMPRLGPGRELKWALEKYLKGALSREELDAVGRSLRHKHLELQARHGIQGIASNDFSYYDAVLDLAHAVNLVEGPDLGLHPEDEKLLLAKGRHLGHEMQALEMTKWFDTNYHFVVPTVSDARQPKLRYNPARRAFQEALAWGYRTQPVLLGPVSLLGLSKPVPGSAPPLSRLPELLPVYRQLLTELAEAGAEWVQLDEPLLSADASPPLLAALETSFEFLGGLGKRPHLLTTTYFGSIAGAIPWLADLPLDGLHLDLTRDPDALAAALESFPEGRVLSLGLIDGRNVWRSNLGKLHESIVRAEARRAPETLRIAPSCSLLHVPYESGREGKVGGGVEEWLAFAQEKLAELQALAAGPEGAPAAFQASQEAAKRRARSALIHRPAVKSRLIAVTEADRKRSLPFEERKALQREKFELPILPTTTIGSFPQTEEVRRTRANFRTGKLGKDEYEHFIDGYIQDAIRVQEELGLDMLVHGEPERNDMVEYFAECLAGFAVTNHGWVQSYGTRAVKPPILFGDVERLAPMTVREAQVAQAATSKVVKGMLTGPVTILKWSFVREDQPWAQTADQVALAVRDEIADLERAGMRAIQVDEAALREGLPISPLLREGYLNAAVAAFRLATGGAQPATQIHTHMCYSDFEAIWSAILGFDADVISIETAKSRMDLLNKVGQSGYPREIGPGVYDIHSPRVPSVAEIEARLRAAASVIPADRLWVNPDCGLKTRSWDEVIPALQNLVSAARTVRAELAQ